MAMRLSILGALFCACLSAQYEVIVPGTGAKAAFVANNPTNAGTSCYLAKSPNNSSVLTVAWTLCSAFDGSNNPYANLNAPLYAQGLQFPAANAYTVGTAAVPAMGLYSRTELLGTSTAQGVLGILNPSNSNPFFVTGVSTGSDVSITFGPIASATSFVYPGAGTSNIGSPSVPWTNGNFTNLGSSGIPGSTLFVNTETLGKAGSVQGSLSIANTGGSPAFVIAGTNFIDPSGADIGVGYLFGASTIYPINGSVSLGGPSDPFNNAYIGNLTVSSCTGCSGSGANQALSNLTNPTSINQSLLFSVDNSFNVGGNNEAANMFAQSLSLGKASRQGQLNIYNVSNSNPGIITGQSTSGTSADLQVGNPFTAGSFYGISNVTLGNPSNPWSTLYVSNIVASGSAGISATIVPSTCSSLTIVDGIITAKAGC